MTSTDKESSPLLTRQEAEEITALAARYPEKSGASVEALKLAQRGHGWVSDEALTEIAALLDMSADELDGVATFYNLVFRRPVGRHVVLLCDSISCWILGYETLRDHVTTRLGIGLGDTTADGRFTVLPTVCLGTCDHAPALMIGDETYGDLDPDRLDHLLEQHR